MKFHGVLLSVVSCLLFLSACSNQTEPRQQPDEVTIQLKWLHQAQFAGFYVAQEKGYYAEENLKVNFLEGGSDVDTIGTIRSNKADFAVVAPEIILMNHQREAPITAIAAIYRRSAVVYVSKKGSGITKPADFINKSIAATATGASAKEFEYQLSAMLNRLGIDDDTIEVVPYDVKYRDFLSGKTDISAAYLTGGVILLRIQGLELNIIWPGDYGIELYSDTLVTTDKLARENPELVERFLRASLKGWNQALGNAEEATEITLKYARVKNKRFQLEMINKLRPLVDTGKNHIGWMDAHAWQNMHDLLLQQGTLSKPIEHLDTLYTTRFLHSIYDKNK